RRFLLEGGARTAAASPSIAGAWAVTFTDADGSTPARGEFTLDGERALGTFLTPTGDYRLLEGDYRDGLLRLSTFDGAHAFLFRARAIDGSTLEGDYWSRDAYHATWKARRIDAARGDDGLPDPFKLTALARPDGRLAFTFPDLDGKPVSLADSRFSGK